jgi:hypothetical protein
MLPAIITPPSCGFALRGCKSHPGRPQCTMSVSRLCCAGAVVSRQTACCWRVGDAEDNDHTSPHKCLGRVIACQTLDVHTALHTTACCGGTKQATDESPHDPPSSESSRRCRLRASQALLEGEMQQPKVSGVAPHEACNLARSEGIKTSRSLRQGLAMADV